MNLIYCPKCWLFLGLLLLSLLLKAEPVQPQMEVYRVVKEKDKETLKPVRTAEPSSILEYQIHHANRTNQPMSKAQISVPLDKRVEFVKGSASAQVPSEFEVSIDNGTSWERPPIIRQRQNQKGVMEKVEVPVSEYTHLRWRVIRPLAAGSTQAFKYRVQVL